MTRPLPHRLAGVPIPAASSPVGGATAGVVAAPVAAPAIAFDLPAWAQNDEARALLATIIAEQPERDRPLTQLATGQTASFGFAGKAANRLRQLFDPFLLDRMHWAQSAGFGTDLYWKRRKAVLDYADRCGPDQLIARMLEARHG